MWYVAIWVSIAAIVASWVTTPAHVDHYREIYNRQQFRGIWTWWKYGLTVSIIYVVSLLWPVILIAVLVMMKKDE
jgi:hypothetical protein